MQARLRRLSAIAVASVAGIVLLPAAVGASSDRRSELRRSTDSPALRSSSTLLELYATETRLDQAQGALTRARARSVAWKLEHAAARGRLTIARRTLARSEQLLSKRLRALYEQGEIDSLEVVLGATSLEEAAARIEALRSAASLDRAIIRRTRAARQRLERLSRALERRVARSRQFEQGLAARAASLALARAERAGYLAELATRKRLNVAELSSLERRAQAALARGEILGARGKAAPGAPTGRPEPGRARTITVQASGYALTGHTATGIPVGWGVVAVDPNLIALGTRMTVPGYGEGVAADIGSAVRGAKIDLWFPTRARALAWGRKTVTVTLH